MPVKVHIFDAKAHALHQAHAGAVKEAHQQGRQPMHVGQQTCNLIFGQNAGNTPFLGWPVYVIEPRQLYAQHFSVKEQHRTQGLVVGRR